MALVTGAGKRIGRAISLGLAAEGWDLALHYHRSQAETEGLATEISALGVNVAAVRCDLGNADQVAGLIAECGRRLGTPTCLVNNASLFKYDDIASLEPEQWRRHLDVNLLAPLLLAKSFAAGIPDGATGCIVNLLDQKVFNLNPDFLSYTQAPLGRSSNPEDIAGAVRFVVNAGALTGTTVVVDGGQHLWSSRRDVQFEAGGNR